MTKKKRFRPLWVSLHWIMAVLVLITFGIGLTSLGKTASSTGKLLPLAVHMALGIAIFLIVVVRYLLRVLVYKPINHTSTIPGLNRKKIPFLDQLSDYVHPMLYLFSALMAVLGIAVALPANLFGFYVSQTDGQLPADFFIYPARSWHGTLSLILLLLIGQHVLVAVFHQFIKGENFLGRMWFSK